jgi:3-dehydroquinate dehydratase-2
MSILVINEPTLDLLDIRAPAICGSKIFSDVNATAKSLASSHGLSLEPFQSNHEGAIIDRTTQPPALGFKATVRDV